MTLYLKLGGREAMMKAMPRLRARLEQDPCFDISRLQKEFERADDFTEFLIFLVGGAPILRWQADLRTSVPHLHLQRCLRTVRRPPGNGAFRWQEKRHDDEY